MFSWWAKQDLSYISICSLSILYNSKFILMTKSLGTNAVSVTRVQKESSQQAQWKEIITKTRLYYFDRLKPHFYTVKLGFTGVYIIFHISPQNIDCGYSLEPPRGGGSNEYPQSMFCAEIWKISGFFYLKTFSFSRWNFLYIWIGVFS